MLLTFLSYQLNDQVRSSELLAEQFHLFSRVTLRFLS